MLPDVFLNIHRLYDLFVDIVERSGGTFVFKGPWFVDMDMLGTIDPANIHHIMNTNFSNYPKGTEFQKMFDIFGDGLFVADSDSWKNQRKIARALITHPRFRQFLVKTTKDKVEKGLIPVLEHVSKQGLVVDLQDLVHRLSLDIGFTLASGFDPKYLSIDLPENKFSKALDEAEQVIFYRHITPEILWKLQRWLKFGQEQKMKKAWETIDHIAAEHISRKRVELCEGKISENEGEFVDLLTSYINMKGEIILSSKSHDEFLRDTLVNFFIAGRENSLSWFFWLVFTHPQVEAKIREELKSIIPAKEAEGWWLFDTEELKKLVYLHAAMCETLRLYPPIPMEHKAPLQSDILPSGHHVNPKMKILFSPYVMGRMKLIWGDDCLEFKPERFIEQGRIKHEPTYKFVAFNTGPRTCIGKEIALTQMKAMAADIIHNYRVQVVEGHPVVPTYTSILLHIKHGLMVRISRRWA